MNDLVNQNGSFYSYQEVGIDGNPLSILKYQGFIDSLSITYTNKINRKSTRSIHTKSYQSFSATKVRDTSNV